MIGFKLIIIFFIYKLDGKLSIAINLCYRLITLIIQKEYVYDKIKISKRS